MLHYKNSGLRLSFSTIMSMWKHNAYKRMNSSSNIVLVIRMFLEKEVSALSQVGTLRGGTKSK